MNRSFPFISCAHLKGGARLRKKIKTRIWGPRRVANKKEKKNYFGGNESRKMRTEQREKTIESDYLWLLGLSQCS